MSYRVPKLDDDGKVAAHHLPDPPTTLPPSGGAGGALAGSYPNPGLNETAVVNAVAPHVADGSALATALGAAFGPAGAAKDGLVKPKSLPFPRQPLRLAAYRVANARPAFKAHNSPDLTTNFRDIAFDGTTSAPFTYWGSTTWQQSGAQGLSGYFGSANPGGTWAPWWDAEFITDSLLFEIKLSTGNSPWQVLVDEEIVYEGATPPTGGSWIQFAWGGDRKMRRYRLRGAMAIQTVRISNSDSILPTTGLGPLVAWVTDSYGQGPSRRPYAFDNYVRMASAMLGWKRYAQNTDGGTGYAQSGAGTQTFLQRVPQVVAANPDAVVWAGGHNMSAAELANGHTGLRTSAAAVFAAARASLPSIPMWALGPLYEGTTFQTSHTAAWDQLALACADYNVTFIDTRGWVTGTGNDSAPVGDGNADALVGPDGTHYNYHGQEYVAVRIAHAIAATL